MEESEVVPPVPWSDALTRRHRALLKTAPFHRLRLNAGRRTAIREHDDPTALCMKALEVLIDALGVRPGATREEVHRALEPLLIATDKSHGVIPDAHRHREVVALVIGTLLNEEARREAYRERYLDFTGAKPVELVVSFKLASERETHEGDIVLKPEADGINLFLRALDVELEDAQAASEAVLHSQLQRGRLDLALQSAREAQLRSLQLDDQVRRLIERTRRDIGRVDWRHEMPTLLSQSLEHLKGRLAFERDLRETVSEHLERVRATPEAIKLVAIRDQLDQCFERHTRLQKPLLEAMNVFREEQERQRFAPLVLTQLPELEEELFRPLLISRWGDALSAVLAFADGMGVAAAPGLDAPGLLWARLLRPPRESPQAGPVVDDAPLSERVEPPPRFHEALCADVDSYLQQLSGPTPLDAVLAHFVDGDAAHFAALRALQAFAPDAGPHLPLRVERTEGCLSDARFFGDGLMLSPEPRDE